MENQQDSKTDYGNWVTKKLVYGTGALGIFFLVLSIAAPVFLAASVLCFTALAYFIYARHLFSPWGGNLQERIRDLVLDRLEWDGSGKALDIGCGNGPLAIETAKRFPRAGVTGIDYWGGMWEYSQAQCEKNALRQGVAARVVFRKASASRLPFPDGEFDAVISNFVFHEVHDARDKRAVVGEALRVLRKGGVFAFQDLFLAQPIYGDPEELREFIRSCGVGNVAMEKTCDQGFIPRALQLPFMVGNAAVLFGRK